MTYRGAVPRLAAAAVTAGLMLVGASAASAGTTPTTTVPSGVDPATLPGSTVFGTTPPSTAETVSFVMRERNESQLESAVEQGMTHFLSVGQFAAQYGASPGSIAALRSYLGRYGIRTTVYPDNVDVVATGTAGEFDQALSIQQHQYHVPAQHGHGGWRGSPAQTVHGTGQPARIPSSFGNDILAILGLSNYAPFTSSAQHATADSPQSESSGTCPAGVSAPADGCNLPQNFASNYGLTGLYQGGAAGQGQTIAIVTLAALDPGAPQYYWQNVAKIATGNRSVTTINVDGGPGAPSDAAGTGETDLDVEQSGGLAPDANVLVYQAPNTDGGFADAFFEAASQNQAGSISSSWGESETYIQATVAAGVETAAYPAAFDEAYLEMAAQGQSGFVSSADEGAYTATGDLGTTNLSVDNPGDSPYITSAGGTTLPLDETVTSSTTGKSGNISVSAQRAWGWDYLWPTEAAISNESLAAAAESDVVGSGGGFSQFYPTPSYQRVPGAGIFSSVPYLTPTDYDNANGITLPEAWDFNPTPQVSIGYGSGREEPDVSADADPYSGYLLYEPSAATAATPAPVLTGGWGGTSFVAPQFNGSTAVIDSAVGHRVGFWNPVMYRASTTPASATSPLDTPGTTNDNIYYSGLPGTVYNPATGLGTPNLTKLAQDFASAQH